MENIDGVTPYKSNETREDKVRENNKDMEKIQFWMIKGQNSRKVIAFSSEEHENDKCPICGRKIEIRDGANGLPLVDARVCGECDKRYVYPFRLRIGELRKKNLKNIAWQNYLIFMQAELSIEMCKKIKSLSADNSEVA